MAEAIVNAYKKRLIDMLERANAATSEQAPAIVEDIRQNIKGLERSATDLETHTLGLLPTNPNRQRAQELEQIIKEANSNVCLLLGYEPQYNSMENPYILLPQGTIDADYFIERTQHEMDEVRRQIIKIEATELDNERLLRYIVRRADGKIDRANAARLTQDQKNRWIDRFWFELTLPVNEAKARLTAFMMNKTPIKSKAFWDKLHPHLNSIYYSLEELRLLQAHGLDA